MAQDAQDRDKRNSSLATIFDRAESLKPCPIGASGACCSTCAMGPCRLTGGKTGVCGATLETVGARNFARAVAAGTSAHADHGRTLAATLKSFGGGNLPELTITDRLALEFLAGNMGVNPDGLDDRELAGIAADRILDEYGRQVGELSLARLAPAKRLDLWRSLGLVPRGIDREVVETLHRTSVGTDQDAEHLLDQALRTALADGWGGSMVATKLSDALFSTPKAVRSETDFGVLDPAAVNIVVHGHEPLLAEMLAVAAGENDFIELARSKGASGINLAGICCTANESLMRRGIPPIGGVTSQEKVLLTGLVDAMIVDVQCVFQSLAEIARENGILLLTTSPKARISGVEHIELGDIPLETAKDIVRSSIENFSARARRNSAAKRAQATDIPDVSSRELVAGFSLEYIEYMLGGRFLASLKPLNDAIVAGYIRGIAAVVGCSNPRVSRGEFNIVRELIRNNILVVQTGCAAIESARSGFMWSDAVEEAGPLLKEICRHLGIPPVLHMGSCVDNSRILAVLSLMVAVGGLGDDISDLPVVGLAPEWMSEKALAIGTYFAASGVPVIFGHRSPVESSGGLTEILSSGWRDKLGGSLEFEPDARKLAEAAIEKIDERRRRLGIVGFGLSDDGRLGDRQRKRQLISWQKKLSSMLS